MKHLKNLLVVGGTGRNTGKTELVCRIISKICMEHRIYGAKTSEIAPGSGIRRAAAGIGTSGHHIYEETNGRSGKDTARMLQAGAHRVFYLQADDENVAGGFQELLTLIPGNMPLICESNTLADYLEPDLFLVVTQGEKTNETLRDRLAKADAVIVSDGHSGFEEVDRIRFTAEGWKL